jgi:hypothetical protein
MKFYGDIELEGSSILNAKIESLAADPAFNSIEAGRIYYNTTDNTLKLNNGSTYINTSLSANFDNLVASLGSNWINPDLSFNPTVFNALNNVSDLTSNSSLYNVIQQLDAAIQSSNLGLLDLNDVTETAQLVAGDLLFYNGTNFTFTDIDTIVGSYGALTLNSLKNVDAATPSDGDFLIYNSVTQKFQNGTPFFYQDDFSNATDHLIAHDLGTQYCAVTIINRNNNQLITNATVTFADINQLQISLQTAAPITVILVGPPNLNQ